MSAATQPQLFQAELKTKFALQYHGFIDAMVPCMLGDQTNIVIDIENMYTHFGCATKAYAKTKIEAHLKNEEDYILQPINRRSYRILINVKSLKVLLRTAKGNREWNRLETYCAMESLLPENTQASNIEQFADASAEIPPPRHVELPTHMPIKSYTNFMDFHFAQVYLRLTDGRFVNVYPIGRPDLALSKEELAQYFVVKLGSQLDLTGRQDTHILALRDSILLDSCVTKSAQYVERNVKDILKNKFELYEGTHVDKSVRDMELVLVKTQEDYNGYVRLVQKGVVEAETSRDVQLVREQTIHELTKKDNLLIQLEIRKVELEMKKMDFDMASLKTM